MDSVASRLEEIKVRLQPDVNLLNDFASTNSKRSEVCKHSLFNYKYLCLGQTERRRNQYAKAFSQRHSFPLRPPI